MAQKQLLIGVCKVCKQTYKWRKGRVAIGLFFFWFLGMSGESIFTKMAQSLQEGYQGGTFITFLMAIYVATCFATYRESKTFKQKLFGSIFLQFLEFFFIQVY